MGPYYFIRASWVCFFALFVLGAKQTVLADSRVNIVLILADDLGYGDVGVYNPSSKIPTPHLDQLAAQGVRFSDAHSPSSVCTPTRYGILTGRYAWRTKLTKGVLEGYSPALIEKDRVTLPSLLRRQGYRTTGIGKWHLGLGDAEKTDYSQPLRPGPNAAGFDEFFGIPASLDMPPYLFFENERVVEAPSASIAASEMRRNGGGGFWRAGAIAPTFKHEAVLPTLTQRAVRFIGLQSPDQPFFLYLPLTAPHTPWMPTAEFRGKTGVDYYGDFVVQVDDTVGQVLKALDESGLAGNTLVVFTSDNGAHWLPEDIAKWGHRANGNWRGQKADIWEGGHRIPLILRWPGSIKPGSRSDQLVCLTDLMATIAALTGTGLLEDSAEDSLDFSSVLLGRKTKAGLRDTIVHHSGDGTFAIRQGHWKLAMALGSRGFSLPKELVPKAGEAEGQLYNLRDDPQEDHNLWLREPKIVARLTTLLEKLKADGHSRNVR
jgi:arylsulfatase A-like enzyme